MWKLDFETGPSCTLTSKLQFLIYSQQSYTLSYSRGVLLDVYLWPAICWGLWRLLWVLCSPFWNHLWKWSKAIWYNISLDALGLCPQWTFAIMQIKVFSVYTATVNFLTLDVKKWDTTQLLCRTPNEFPWQKGEKGFTGDKVVFCSCILKTGATSEMMPRLIFYKPDSWHWRMCVMSLV